MQEYSNSSKTTKIGLPCEIHESVKDEFENSDLKRIFQFCLKVLAEIVNIDTPYPCNIVNLLEYLLQIIESILNWGFYSSHILSNTYIKYDF